MSWNPDPLKSRIDKTIESLRPALWTPLHTFLSSPKSWAKKSDFPLNPTLYWRMVHEGRCDVVIYPLTAEQTVLHQSQVNLGYEPHAPHVHLWKRPP